MAEKAGTHAALASNRSKKWLLEAVQKVPEVRDARQAKLVPAQAGIQFNNEAYFLYVE
jgi:hypothetical protein